MDYKKILSVILSVVMFVAVCTSAQFAFAEELEIITPPFAESNQLYAQGIDGAVSAQAWQKWSSYYGSVNAESQVKYFFLPASASDTEFEVYNSYDSTAVVNGVEIPPNSAMKIAYSNGSKYRAECAGQVYTYAVYKTDSDASVYVNDTTGYYENAEGIVYNDFYSFLIANKENAVKGSDIAIVADGEVAETTLKKIKGRGNTTWKTSDKKPFTLTFNSAVSIAGLESKKFSMLSNSKDGSLLRNKVMYDLADAVEQPYSPDTRFIDFFINGVYRGSFQISKKVEMGKSSLVTLKDTSDKGVTEDFNFLVEIDIWNYQNDTHFTSSMGQEIVLNTPELEDYDPTDPIQKGQMDFIQYKYNELERALYQGDMSELEQICDVESLAKTYLVNEFSKNCDGGLTSTYYSYNADEGKFYAAPVWDFDSGLGNVDCIRAGASQSTKSPEGWLTKTITNNATAKGKVNTLGQAFNLSGTTSDGMTYEDIVKRVWTDKFVPAIKLLLGKTDAQIGRLKSIDAYKASIQNASYANYVMWGFEWAPLDRTFPNTYDGQVNYLKSWTEKRYNWMAERLTIEPEKETKRFYFANTLGWDNVDCYSWSEEDTYSCKWPGYSAVKLSTTENGTDVYYCDVPAEHTFIIWNDTKNISQTVDIELDNVNNYYTPIETESASIVHVTPSVWGGSALPTTEAPTTEFTPVPNVKYYLVGLGFDGWDSRNYPMTICSDGTAVLDFTFEKDVYYHFKVVEYTDDSITNYYQQDTDEITNKYLTMVGLYNNSDITPAEDTRLIITFDIARGLFTAKPYTESTEPVEATTVTEPVTTVPITTVKPTYPATTKPTEPSTLIGDADGNGVINILDATCIQKYIAELETDVIYLELADANCDGLVNVRDVTTIQKIIAKIL